MPRPGPRPYECVRKAWHSDRHLPVRGSLIQEIFRLVNEVHRAETRKNKEWQEKIPVVVLRAEEIMYSKANSEAEYVDLKTLRDRVNDAINIIIRCDDDGGSEDTKLLLPCIEAALQLGCIPRRSSRSQRNNNPGCYLSAGTSEDLSFSPQNNNLANQTPYSPCMPHQAKSTTAAERNYYPSWLTSDKPSSQICSQRSSCPKSNLQRPTLEPHHPLNLYSTYPLYIGDPLQCEEYNLKSITPTSPNLQLVEPGILSVKHDSASSKAPIENSQAVTGRPMKKPHEVGCDLSLRLGPLLKKPCISSDSTCSQEVESDASGSSQQRRKLGTPLQHFGSDFCFLPKVAAEELLDSSSMKQRRESKINVEGKEAVISHSSENGQSDWHLKLTSNRCCGRMIDAGP